LETPRPDEDVPQSTSVATLSTFIPRLRPRHVEVETPLLVVEEGEEALPVLIADEDEDEVVLEAVPDEDPLVPTMAFADELPSTAVVPPVQREPRRVPVMGIIIGVFMVLLLGSLAFVSWFKISGKGRRAQRLEALHASARPQGSDLDVRLLLGMLDDLAVRDKAADTLGRLEGGDYIDRLVLGHLPTVRQSPACAALTQVIGRRRLKAAFPEVLEMIHDNQEKVRQTAWTALGQITTPTDLPRLIETVRMGRLRDRSLMEKAIAAAVEKAEDRTAATQAVLKSYQAPTTDVPTRAVLLNALIRVGGADTLGIVTAAITDADDAIRRAAIAVLADHPTHEPLTTITERFPLETDPACRAYITVAAAELVTKPGPLSQDELSLHAQSLYVNAQTAGEKQRALAAIRRVVAPATAKFYKDYAQGDDPALRQEALDIHLAFRARLARVVAIAPGSAATPLPAERADLTVGGEVTLNEDALVNWTQPTDHASWLVELPTNGDYEIAVYQAHGSAETGTYEVQIAGQTLLTRVVQTASDVDFKGFVIGKVSIAKPSIYKLTLKPKTIPTGTSLFVFRNLAVKLL